MFFADTGVPMPSVQLELLVSFIGSIFTSAWKDRMSQFFVKAYVSILLAQQPHWTWLDRHLFVSRLSHKKCVRSRWKFRWIVIFSPSIRTSIESEFYLGVRSEDVVTPTAASSHVSGCFRSIRVSAS